MRRFATAAAVLGGLAIIAGFVSLVGVVAGSGAPGEDLLVGAIELSGGLVLLIVFRRRRAPIVFLNIFRVVAWTLLIGGGYLAFGHIVGLLTVGHVVVVVLVAFAAGGEILWMVRRRIVRLTEADGATPLLAGSPALISPGLRSSLRTYQRNSVAIAVAGVTLVLAAIGLLSFFDVRHQELERTGQRGPGTVLEYSGATVFSPDSVVVEFGPEAELRTARVWLDDSSPRYSVGDQVTVVIDPDHPERVSLLGESNLPPLATWPVDVSLIGGIFAACFGIAAVLRAYRQEYLLSSTRWTRIPVRSVAIRPGIVTGPLVTVDTPEPPDVMTIAACLRRRVNRSGLLDAETVDYAKDIDDYIVLRVPDSNLVLSAQLAPGGRLRRWWQDVFSR